MKGTIAILDPAAMQKETSYIAKYGWGSLDRHQEIIPRAIYSLFPGAVDLAPPSTNSRSGVPARPLFTSKWSACGQVALIRCMKADSHLVCLRRVLAENDQWQGRAGKFVTW